jgi:hypothetical protein
MPFSVNDLTKEDCRVWKQNKLLEPDKPKNPKTQYRVIKGNKTYNAIENRCKKLLPDSPVQASPKQDSPAAASPIKQASPKQASPEQSPAKEDVKKTKKEAKQLTRELCEQWEENKLKNPDKPRNPLTNYGISAKSGIYKSLNKNCAALLQQNPGQSPKKPSSNKKPKEIKPVPKGPKTLLFRPLNLQDCILWAKDRTRNPLSGYSLSEKSPILKEIQKQCKPLLDAYTKPTVKQSSSKSSSKASSKKASIASAKSVSPVTSPARASPVSTSPARASPARAYPESSIDLYYPDLEDKHFREKLTKMAEFYIYNVPKYPQIKSKDDFEKVASDLCGDFEKTAYQYFVSSYISSRTPYKSILLYHGVGVGKTCSAITLAEGFLTSHSMYSEPKVWVIMPLALKNSFKEQIFSLSSLEDFEHLANQCTGDLYIKLGQILRESNKDKLQTKIKKLIKSRYQLFTYDAFATFIENEYISKGRVVKDKVIIVDEAHNIRTMSAGQVSSESSMVPEKRVYTSLVNVLENGINNRLVLLSATPMYNKPDDIFDLLYLLCLNDKRTDLMQPFPALFNDKNVLNKQAVKVVEKLATNYISYLKGKNPFTFAVKLSPKYLADRGLKFLEKEYIRDSNNKVIADTFNGWLSHIEDGIVTSELGEKQLEYISRLAGTGDDNNVFNNLQPMNIVYDDGIGERGFNTVFTRNDDNNSLNVRYNKNYQNALYPDAEHLGKYSGKFLNICNIIKNTSGVAVIYSGYIWSGIIPMAIALEHMGFEREGTANILNKPDVISDAPNYGKKTTPKYCILSSENSEIMGSTSIDNMMKVINSPRNIDGSQIKVILITPVAGEGLSFYNVREMHLVEPWFHFNRVTQIIGRGIRNCRHQQLPLEERNVTVFMHGSVYPVGDDDNDDIAEKETTDIHAFRIASKKMIQSAVIDEVIRDNAVDCSLMKNINYFPKSLFELAKVKIRTSQNVEIDYQYGDPEEIEPKCRAIVRSEDNSKLRKEAFQNLIFGMQNRLRKMVLEAVHNGVWYISFEDILNRLQIHKTIVYETVSSSVYPNVLLDGYILVPHEGGLHIVDMSVDKYVPDKLRITYKKKSKKAERAVDDDNQTSSKCNMTALKKIMEDAENSPENDIMKYAHTVLTLYTFLTSECFEELVKRFIETPELSEMDENVAQILYREGALIHKNELKSVKTGGPSKYIGYVNIFNSKFEPVVFVEGRYRDLIDREVDELISKRRRVQKPANMATERTSWGMIVPTLDKKTGMYSNVFKVLTVGSAAGVKTGMVCTSLSKPAQEKLYEEFDIREKLGTKVTNCHQIAMKMYADGRITVYPEYKP